MAHEVARYDERLEPALVSTFREGYSWSQLGRDAGAGVVVGVVALPISIAFAIASGLKPEQGLYTAVVAGFLISACGGSRIQIGGPTGAFIVIVYDIVSRYGYEGLAVATMMAGVLLILMGLARLGTVIKFVPYPVTVGFTAGIALIIAVSQLRDFLGLRMDAVPADFLAKLAAYGRHLGSVDGAALGVGVVAVLVVAGWPRVSRWMPGPLVAVVATTLLVQATGLPVETVGDRFGPVAASLPAPRLPIVDWALARELVPSAVSIALLAAIESLLSAVVADGMAGTRHRSNMELIAQGVANLASPIFGGMPATGAIARTATNVKHGARSPVAGIVHALTLLLVMVCFAPLAARIPLATLAGILLVVAYNMSEWRVFVRLFRSPRSDVVVLLVTFALTVLVDLTVALQTGVVLASLLFMRRMAAMSEVRQMRHVFGDADDGGGPRPGDAPVVPPGVEVFEIYGTLFFGAARKFTDALTAIERPPRVLVLRMRDVLAIDATGLRALEDVVEQTAREGTALVLSGVHAQPLVALERSGLLERIGEENVFDHVTAAMRRAREITERP